ncbi:Surfactin synthase thioesterase subunit [Streptomyces sp. 1222.5]|uniref:thioesterase II family protein n=1 Tax=unclassified Streptomyces TaxID=2593676 RepID=UPI00089C7FB5|nr:MULTISPECIES: alpha/beta fold hydrolase [unclassified Streptomyces]PKW00403.1 surfactin synthase thioesterase subunit [Streptomyces sp. 5112.2]SED87133.1 Surfactin synthase thioesterase subunit [Streptomyces sp. 1222.5]
MTWLTCTVPRPEAPIALVCFPHAGGSAHVFREWAAAFPDIEVHAVSYPGRAHRIAEPVPSNLRRLAADIRDATRPLLHRPTAFLGHSMGAAVAFETALLLQRDGTPVSHLFASSCRALHLPRPTLPDGDDGTAVLKALAELGGTEPEVLADPVLRDLVVPYVLGDLQMFDTYRYRPGDVLHCPVTAITGLTDIHVTPEQAAAWSAMTRGPFRCEPVLGGHFHLTHEPPFGMLRESLVRHPAPGSPLQACSPSGEDLA